MSRLFAVLLLFFTLLAPGFAAVVGAGASVHGAPHCGTAVAASAAQDAVGEAVLTVSRFAAIEAAAPADPDSGLESPFDGVDLTEASGDIPLLVESSLAPFMRAVVGTAPVRPESQTVPSPCLEGLERPPRMAA
jgi:hypothetical protein